MQFKNGSHCSHYGGHFGSYFQYGRQNTLKISKCSNALEHFEILRILPAILKMAAKMTAILKLHWSRSHSSKNP
jgi:hypothetical protein